MNILCQKITFNFFSICFIRKHQPNMLLRGYRMPKGKQLYGVYTHDSKENVLRNSFS